MAITDAALGATIQALAMSVEWTPLPRRPWVVREPDGRVIRRFDSAPAAIAFRTKEAARRARVAARLSPA
ncbi:hypothetical protein LCGC14_1262820 [marine sediment metagenome]|uniref:Uncharacterized protein n=1 Tax=marine sediment metagenome TaxID=412755 RepID=A0A0F9L053_9ZZZZ